MSAGAVERIHIRIGGDGAVKRPTFFLSLILALGLLAAGCTLPPVPESASGGSQAQIPDQAKLKARIAGYYQAAATGNGPAMWPYMLGSVANGKEKEYYSSTSLPRAAAQVRIEKAEKVSVHSDFWGVKPDAMVHVHMQAYDRQTNAWAKLKATDTWYYMKGQWYLGKGM